MTALVQLEGWLVPDFWKRVKKPLTTGREMRQSGLDNKQSQCGAVIVTKVSMTF